MRNGSYIGVWLVAVLASLLLWSLPVAAHPDGLSLAVNFGADEPMGARSDVLGAAGVLRTEVWNNLDGAAGGPVVLVGDNKGVEEPTDVTIEWNATNTWASTGRGEENNTAPAGDDRNLMTGYLDTAPGAATITVTGLDTVLEPGDTYTVYVYINGGVTGRGGDYSIGDQVISVVDTDPFDGTYVKDENFIVFEDLTGDSFTLTATPTTGAAPRAPVNAIEIVLGSAPELKVPLRTVTPEHSEEECPPGGLGPITVKISQVLPEGAGAGDAVTVIEEILGPVTKDDVTASQGGQVENVYPTGISPNGYINAWLILGPYAQGGGAAPGQDNIRQDYLTDGGDVTEFTVQPKAGDTVNTDYGVAASTGLVIEDPLNPGGVPTWNFYLNPATDTIDLINDHYGRAANNSMAYAVTYVHVEADLDPVNLCVGSDDAVQVLIDGEEVWINDIARGWGTGCQDEVPLLDGLEAGLHMIMVKVFQGGGGHGFRLGFFDPGTGEPAPGITVCTTPDFDPTANPCVWDPIGARITWDTTRGQVADGLSYTVNIREGNLQFNGTVGDERIQGHSKIALGCDTRVTNLTCTEKPDGSVELTWDNHPFADSSVDISILNNGQEVAKVPGTATSVTVAAGDLVQGFNELCVINSSGQPVCCTVVKNALILSDMVAGGDGTGTADPQVIGIDPDTGILQTAYLNADVTNTGDNPQEVTDDQAPYVDSVFIIDQVTAPGGEMPITALGIDGPIFAFDPMDLFNTYGYILKDATHDVDKGIFEIWAGGTNTWTNCVAIHAAAGITFDLDAIRSDLGDPVLFTCFAGADQCTSAAISLYAIVSDDVDIIDFAVNNGDGAGVTANTGAPMELAIPPEAKYFTLAVGAFNGTIACDHGVFANAVLVLESGQPGETTFKRGDINADGTLNIADPIALLGTLFGGEADPPCRDAADANDDGAINIADPIAILGYLFGGEGDLPPPFASCGPDPTADDIECESFPPCKQ